MPFAIAGSLTGSAPIIRTFFVGETVYEGCLVSSQTNDTSGGTGGVVLADVASEAHENDQPILGICVGVVDESRAYSSTYYGNGSTYTTTQATIASTGTPRVKVALAIPWVTLIKGPIYNAAYGTALTKQVVTTASSGGVTITAANNAITDIADDYAVAYCRKGANRGHYRVVTTSTSTTVNTVVVPFPYGIALGDVFVIASCVPGLGGLDIPATANCIDGNNDIDAYYDVYYHEVNLEESGKEYAVFSLLPKACSLGA
uniref:Uncharacterized protein n=1 Tax=viral metagenome TaxID=1070528 RepID=A0A6H1ZME6_9ZZZZ